MIDQLKMEEGRHAISEVVSTLLIVAIVASLGVVVFEFASGSLGGITQNFANLISNRASGTSEKFVVEQVVFAFSAPTGADVYVRNVGTVASTLVSVYIVDQSVSTFVKQAAISTQLNVGTVVDIPHATLSFTPLHGHTYSFTVTSNLGNSVTFDAEAT